jgi:hypothetical protein
MEGDDDEEPVDPALVADDDAYLNRIGDVDPHTPGLDRLTQLLAAWRRVCRQPDVSRPDP